jgi:hypothetical protein
MSTYLIDPYARTFWLRARLIQPMSHHDPARADKSNVSLFRRQKQFVPQRDTGRLPTQAELDALCHALPLPADIAPFFEELPLSQFLATALLRLFIDMYGGGEGEGLFAGMERYRRLEERFAQAATRAATLINAWSFVCADLQVGIPDSGENEAVLRLLTVPSTLGGLVLRELAENPRTLVMLAREWSSALKLQNPDYAAKAKRPVASPTLATLHFAAESAVQGRRRLGLEVPCFSGNSVRHEMVREPGMWHLLSRLGLHQQELPEGVAQLLYNGGDLDSSAPNDVFKLQREIAAAFPLLGLIGGATDGFVLGSSNLEVGCWVICQENNDALQLAGMQSDLSIFDMLDRETLTRHTAGRVGGSPMPFSFEVLAKGAEMLIGFSLRPYTTELEMGALMAALATYRDADSTLGGQGARGMGRVLVDWVDGPIQEGEERRARYEAYLEEHRDALRDALLTGTLGAGKVVCR